MVVVAVVIVSHAVVLFEGDGFVVCRKWLEHMVD
jgi:hypothetical protein